MVENILKKIQSNKKLTSTKKISMLVTIVKKNKIDYYLDLISDYNSNMQISMIGNGTTKATVFSDDLGGKGIILSVVTEDYLQKLLKALEEKFEKDKDSKGVAFAVPISSVMGVTFFNFLSNNKTKFEGKAN